MMKNETIIWVYADWEPMEAPQLMGAKIKWTYQKKRLNNNKL